MISALEQPRLNMRLSATPSAHLKFTTRLSPLGTRLRIYADITNGWDTYGTLETLRKAEGEAIPYANWRAKCLGLKVLAEREGFGAA
jgi:hypothetical protein